MEIKMEESARHVYVAQEVNEGAKEWRWGQKIDEIEV